MDAANIVKRYERLKGQKATFDTLYQEIGDFVTLTLQILIGCILSEKKK